MKTHVYNIAFSETTKQAYLHFWGCNIGCRGCLCKRGLASPPTEFLEFEEVIDTIDQLGARWVLFEGQEASIDPQMPFLAEALHRRLGTTNVLLTNAFQMPDLKHIDKISVGLKAFDEELHMDYTGKSNKTVLENFERIYRSGVPMMAETVLIPGYIDKEEIEKIARFIAGIDKNIRYQIDAYFKAGDNPWRRPSAGEVEAAAAVANRYLSHVYFYKGTETCEFSVKSIFPSEVQLADEEPAQSTDGRELVLV